MSLMCGSDLIGSFLRGLSTSFSKTTSPAKVVRYSDARGPAHVHAFRRPMLPVRRGADLDRLSPSLRVPRVTHRQFCIGS